MSGAGGEHLPVGSTGPVEPNGGGSGAQDVVRGGKNSFLIMMFLSEVLQLKSLTDF